MKWVYHNGIDRQPRRHKNDCATRALAIALDIPYAEAAKLIKFQAKSERRKRRSSPSHGVYIETFRRIMFSVGWVWVPTMHIGSGCKVHMREEELPPGRIIVNLSKHVAAVIDGVLYDICDQTRRGKRCVYGYWREPNQSEMRRRCRGHHG